MEDHQGLFPVSVIIAGFCIMSFAYLICFCCCIVQFLMRQGRRNATTTATSGGTTGGQPLPRGMPQKNEKLRNQLWRQFDHSLKRFKKQGNRRSLRDASCAGACSICFDDYSGDPSEILVGYIKTCGHYFHFDCIWQWLETRQSCPLCRTPARLKETDIKGLALRHIDEYKKEANRSAGAPSGGGAGLTSVQTTGAVNMALQMDEAGATVGAAGVFTITIPDSGEDSVDGSSSAAQTAHPGSCSCQRTCTCQSVQATSAAEGSAASPNEARPDTSSHVIAMEVPERTPTSRRTHHNYENPAFECNGE